MPCIPLPKSPSPPKLPTGLSIPVPAFSVGLPGFCCTNSPVNTPPLPKPIDALALNPAILAAINQAIEGIVAYIDLGTIDCPREA